MFVMILDVICLTITDTVWTLNSLDSLCLNMKFIYYNKFYQINK